MLTIVFAVFAACFILECFFAEWSLPKVPTCAIRVIGLNLTQLAVVIVAGEAWEKWFQA